MDGRPAIPHGQAVVKLRARETSCAARGCGKGFHREGRCLPSESQPSSYLVNKDILLGVIPAEQDGWLRG